MYSWFIRQRVDLPSDQEKEGENHPDRKRIAGNCDAARCSQARQKTTVQKGALCHGRLLRKGKNLTAFIVLPTFAMVAKTRQSMVVVSIREPGTSACRSAPTHRFSTTLSGSRRAAFSRARGVRQRLFDSTASTSILGRREGAGGRQRSPASRQQDLPAFNASIGEPLMRCAFRLLC